MRTTESSVTFRHPFLLSPFDGSQPAGRYRLVVDEEEILGLSFVAYRRLTTMIQLPALTEPSGTTQVFEISPSELAEALAADEALASAAT